MRLASSVRFDNTWDTGLVRAEGEQIIRFCFKIGHRTNETFSKLQQAYGDSVLSRSQVFRLKTFSEGKESTKDEPQSGRTSSSKNDKNFDIIRDLVSLNHPFILF